MKLHKLLPSPRESFFWTVGYLTGPMVDRLMDKALHKAGEYLVKLSIRLAMRNNTSGQRVDASTSPDAYRESSIDVDQFFAPPTAGKKTGEKPPTEK